MEPGQLKGEEYRNSISTITKDGKRAWVYAKKVKGRLYNYRQLFGYTLLAFLFIVPFIKLHGEPLVMFNILERKFIIFGMIFWPQDAFLFYIMMLTFIVFIVLFTVMFGRLFCGWACPQTIFLELVFRRIEWLIDGTPAQQKKLKAQNWNAEKIFKRILKHTVFWLISFIIANFLLSFIIGMDKLLQIISEPISEHKSGLIGMIIFSSAFYFIYAWFREQVCSLMCPYGRLQSVLIDKDTIQVSYDYFRGEPRGVAKKGDTEAAEKLGDCIDCKECIKVCPTGIDIKNGSQLECVNCTACIDACNSVMTRIGKPKGLIRYASENGLKTGKSFRFTPRNIAYTTVLIGILIFLATLFITRTDVEATILRARGLTYQEQPDNQISNLYNITIVNKTRTELNPEIRLISPKGKVEIYGNSLKLAGGESVKAAMIVFLNKDEVKGKHTTVRFGIYDGDKLLEEVKTNFVGP